VALTITVLFTDLVDSTALMSRVGEEAAEELRREHFALLREAFGPCGGDEVKNLGDGLMVVFPSAADAVAGAVAAQQAFEHRNRRATEAMSIRVGVAVGDADVDDGDYFGVPVVQAARLCATAGGDEILISEMVRMLAGARGGFVFESVGELALKGLDEQVPACRCVGSRSRRCALGCRPGWRRRWRRRSSVAGPSTTGCRRRGRRRPRSRSGGWCCCRASRASARRR
jgi:class 3 adenylate cyclase